LLSIYEHETANGAVAGMIVQFGGQTPLNLSLPLKPQDEHHRHIAANRLTSPKTASVSASSSRN